MQQKPMSRLAGQCAAVLLALISLSGCAEFLAGREQRAQGWREARVVPIEAGASIGRISEIERSAEWDCRKGVAPDAAANGRYVVYQFKGVSNSRWYRIAPLPDNVQLEAGDLVDVNIENCTLSPTRR